MPQLDALRGIAAFIVLLHHSYGLTGIVLRTDASLADRFFHTLLHFSPLQALRTGRGPVLFFFVLSGFVLTAALLRRGSPGLIAFAAQRSIRLLLPVVASVLLSFALYHAFANQALLHAVGSSLWTPAPDAWDALREAALLRTERPDVPALNTVLWSLVHEWRLTLLMPLVLLFVGRPWLMLAPSLLCMALGVLCGAAENEVHLGPWLHSSLIATLYFAPGIATGAALALAGTLPRLDRLQRIVAGVTALALFGLESDLAAYAASVLLIVLAVQPGRLHELLGRRPLVWLGRVSFSLYLVHVPILVATLCALHGLVPRGVALGTGMLTALAGAEVMHRLVERPSRDLAVRAERRLARPAPAGRALGAGPAEPLAPER